ncbi:MAG: hypothetical protein HC862_14165 [Scytonema sp. RU_4_4]|nr:hypothetical protein [Scytonema sp. RU_4_4]
MSPQPSLTELAFLKNRLLAHFVAVRTWFAQTRRLNASVAARQTKPAHAGFIIQ